jgi:hypothetical protein
MAGEDNGGLGVDLVAVVLVGGGPVGEGPRSSPRRLQEGKMSRLGEVASRGIGGSKCRG